MRKLSSAIVGCIALVYGADLRAAPLGLTLLGDPDFTANFIDLSYVANNAPNNFSATGYNVALDDDGVGPLLDPFVYNYGDFSLTASITTAGLMTGGTLVVSGNYSNTIGLSGVLLTGNLTAFGFTDGPTSELFEFTYTVTGGLMATAQYFGLPGSPGGVIYDTGENVFNGLFTSDFGTSGFGSGGNADVAPIPEPATLSLFFLGGAILLRPVRRR